MQITGAYDTSGRYMPYQDPVEVHPFGNKLIDTDGWPWAVKDEYGDWVSPSLKKIGIKSKIKVVQ